MAVLSMTLFFAAYPFYRAAALLATPSHTSAFFDPAKRWMGEATLHELFDDDAIHQLQENGFIKTRQNPDYPDRTQYFVVKTPADANFIYSECPPKHSEDTEVENHETANAQNLGKEWVNTEKLREEYGDDNVEKLVKSGLVEKRQHPGIPQQTQLGRLWISTENLLDKYGFDVVEELLKRGSVQKRQNPSCPERTQYFVKEEPLNSVQSEDEEDQNPEETKVNRDAVLHKHGDEEAEVEQHEKSTVQDKPKVQKHGKANKHKGNFHLHNGKAAEVQQDEDGTVQKHDEPKLRKRGKTNKHKGKLQQHDRKNVDVQKHEDEVQTHGKAKDVDVVADSGGEERSAAIPAHALSTVVAIATILFFA